MYATGITHQQQEAPTDLLVNGVKATYYFDYTYKPVRNDAGEVYALLIVANDVTERVLARRKAQEQELRLRALFEQAPAAISTVRGPQ